MRAATLCFRPRQGYGSRDIPVRAEAPSPIERDSQAVGHLQKYRPALPALGNHGASLRERCSTRAIDKYAFQRSGLRKTEAAKSRKQRRTLKQIHEDLKELGFEGFYDRGAAFARTLREGKSERGNRAANEQTIVLPAGDSA